VVFTGVIVFDDLYEPSTERRKGRKGRKRKDGGWEVKEDIRGNKDLREDRDYHGMSMIKNISSFTAYISSRLFKLKGFWFTPWLT
jgi:hypothetical protein